MFEAGLATLTGIVLDELLDTIPLKDTDSPGGQNWVITAQSVEKLQDESEGIDGPCGAGAVSIYCLHFPPEEEA